MSGLERKDRYVVVPDTNRRGHWRVQDSVTGNLIGRSYQVRRHAQCAASARNE